MALGLGACGATAEGAPSGGAAGAGGVMEGEAAGMPGCSPAMALRRELGTCGEVVSPVPLDPPSYCQATATGWDCQRPEGSYWSYALGASRVVWTISVDSSGNGWVTLVAYDVGGQVTCEARYVAEGVCY